MPVKEVLVCSKCGATIEDDPMLGDRQGGRVQIVMGADTWELVLCTKHKQPLYDLYGDCVEKYLPGGTATGAETIRYLPRMVDEVNPSQRSSSAGHARVTEVDGKGVVPPSFSGEK